MLSAEALVVVQLLSITISLSVLVMTASPAEPDKPIEISVLVSCRRTCVTRLRDEKQDVRDN